MDPDPVAPGRPPLNRASLELVTVTAARLWSGVSEWVRRARVDPASAAVTVLVVAGIAVRVGFWWQGRSFWRDELALVQSLDAYSTIQLLGPLSDAQSAPPMWLWAERAVTTVLGDGERAYRLLPMLAGCLALVLLARLALRLIRRRPLAVVPVAIAATIPEVVFYGAQTKQYTTDVALVCLLLLASLRLLSTPEPRRRPLLAWYALLVVAPWFSHGFMLCAPLIAAWVSLVLVRRGTLSLPRAALGLVVPAASVGAAGLLARHLTSQVSSFTSYWADYLGPKTLDPQRWLDWHQFVVSDLLVRELGGQVWWLAGLLAVAGIAVSVRRARAIAVLIALPLATAYLASVVGVYPFGRRLAMYCLPSLLLWFGLAADGAAGAAGLLATRSRRWLVDRFASAPPARSAARFGRITGGLVVVVLLAVAAWCPPPRLVSELRYQYGVDDYRTAFAHIGRHLRAGDVIITGNGDRAAARVYAPRFDIPTESVLRAFPVSDTDRRSDCPLPRRVAEADRVWLVNDDQVPVYAGVSSRYALVAPLTGEFRQIYQHVRGMVTVQLLLRGTDADPQATRCLQYAPLGPAGSAKYPDALPAS